LEREWRQSVTDATTVFSRIDKDLGALGGRVGLDEHKLQEHEAMIKSFEGDCSRVLFRIHALEQRKKEHEERIETLEMSVAFMELNGAADAMRIQCLEERLEDVVTTMGAMSDHLCSCNKEVRVSWFSYDLVLIRS